MLDFGWSEYLTVNARESNLRSDGLDKIPLGSNDLADLYDQIADEFDESSAACVVAYRIFLDMASPSAWLVPLPLDESRVHVFHAVHDELGETVVEDPVLLPEVVVREQVP